jgi:dsDNA-binding SOS-regulon protein
MRYLQTVCVVLAVMTAAGAVWAQEAGGQASIIARVKFTQQQFLELTDRMLEVADLLEGSEPESAAVLREAVRQARRAFIAEDMERVASSLTEGLTSAAATGQTGIVAELEKLLALLQAGAMNLQERAERLKEWREQLADIEKMLDKQRTLADQTKLTADAAELDEQLASLSRKMNEILLRQTKLRDATVRQAHADDGDGMEQLGKLRDRLQRLAERQEGLLQSTGQVGIDKLPLVARVQRELAEQVAQARDDLQAAAADPAVAETGIEASALAEIAELADQAAQSMTGSAGELDRPNAQQSVTHQQSAKADLDTAAQALTDLLRQAAAAADEDQIAQRQADLADETSELADAISAIEERVAQSSEDAALAGEEMAEAARDLAEGRPGQAKPHQDEALRRLAEEKTRLAMLRDCVAQQAARPLEDQATEQKELADRAERAANQMAGDASTEPTPGQPSVAEAGSQMKQAGERLDQQEGADSASQANERQQEAIEQLEQARETLAEAVGEEEQKQDAQRLTQIDRILQEVLDGQKNITTATKTIDAGSAEGFDRPAQLKLAELSRGEGKLAEEVTTVVTLLSEEGRSIVFPTVLADVAKQLGLLQTRLADKQPGAITQSIQEDVETTLADMLEAIRKEISRRRNEGGGGGGGAGGGGGGGKPKPLLPAAAELKLLWRMQQQITRRTAELNTAEAALTEQQRRVQHEHLAERQKQLYDMAVEMDRLAKEAKAASGQPEEAQP